MGVDFLILTLIFFIREKSRKIAENGTKHHFSQKVTLGFGWKLVFKLDGPSSTGVENRGLVDPILGSFRTPNMPEIAVFGYFL